MGNHKRLDLGFIKPIFIMKLPYHEITVGSLILLNIKYSNHSAN